jgi:hypothetical protein
MDKEMLLVTVVSSLLSGLVGVIVSSIFFSRLERRKLKIETARKLFGSRHEITGKEFQEAMNEVMIVFSDCSDVIDSMENLWRVVDTPKNARPDKAADDALILLMKSICKDIGIKYKKLSDAYYLRFFIVPK